MAKSIEQRLKEAIGKKEKLEKSKEEIMLQLKNVNELIKQLEKEKRQAEGEAVIKRIEAKGFSLEDILELMEKEKNENQEGEMQDVL